MDVRALLGVVRDISVLGLGLAGVIHEEFYTSVQRPALIGLYGLCLFGLAYAKGRKLVQVLTKMASEDEEEQSASTTAPGTSGSPPSRRPPRSQQR